MTDLSVAWNEPMPALLMEKHDKISLYSWSHAME